LGRFGGPARVHREAWGAVAEALGGGNAGLRILVDAVVDAVADAVADGGLEGWRMTMRKGRRDWRWMNYEPRMTAMRTGRSLLPRREHRSGNSIPGTKARLTMALQEVEREAREGDE